ncbi:hypothetical protein C8R43DRAFT_899060 [Mycena crocata]|nr:hypothetical protein C8R43DRAFT_899060 [Mycena crocata]
MDSFAKLSFLLAAAVLYDRAFAPTTVPTTEEQKRTVGNSSQNIGWFEGLVMPILPVWSRIMCWSFTATEVAIILTCHFQGHAEILSTRLAIYAPSSSHNTASQITPAFLLGISLIIIGTTIRFHCVRAMGRHFTYALSLRDDHRLITTGPYTIVRHPSYTGANMAFLGSALIHMGSGSWWYEGGCKTGWGKLLAVNYVVCVGFHVPSFTRGAAEDAYLKGAFGQEWERFAEKVPYRYIPWVY